LLDVGFGFGFGFGFIGTDVDGKGRLILVPQGGVSSVWISQQVSSVSKAVRAPVCSRKDRNECDSNQALTYACRELAYMSVISEWLMTGTVEPADPAIPSHGSEGFSVVPVLEISVDINTDI
jgi:hypothetical protein